MFPYGGHVVDVGPGDACSVEPGGQRSGVQFLEGLHDQFAQFATILRAGGITGESGVFRQ